MRLTLKSLINQYGPLFTLLALLPLWEFACWLFTIPTFILPSPIRIIEAFMGVDGDRWLLHLWSTLRVALIGFALSLAISLPVAIVMVQSSYLNRTLYPLLVVVQSTPVVAIAPLLIVILGSGEAPRLVITGLITFFPLVVAATTGMLATPPEMIELSRSLKAPRYREVWQIRLPYAVPFI
ncbi:MAG: ABC transporter permease subunit, partial [Pseudohongiellaceae bacterium]